ncbi:SMI1/KNR4 family protein [Streptomyces sp. NPDC055089]
MSDRSLPPEWLASWLSRISAALNAMTEGFERRHGFHPGANEVRPADRDDQAAVRMLAQVGFVHPDLVTFYEHVALVTWADIGNGYFVAPAGDVLVQLAEYGAVELGAEQGARGLVIGSNGGGLSYVAGPAGAVYRTRTASLDEPELDRVADDLRQFLELMEQALMLFIANGEPGHL